MNQVSLLYYICWHVDNSFFRFVGLTLLNIYPWGLPLTLWIKFHWHISGVLTWSFLCSTLKIRLLHISWVGQCLVFSHYPKQLKVLRTHEGCSLFGCQWWHLSHMNIMGVEKGTTSHATALEFWISLVYKKRAKSPLGCCTWISHIGFIYFLTVRDCIC